MNYFKSFGYVTCAHAISFANDLKIAHYVKVGQPHLATYCSSNNLLSDPSQAHFLRTNGGYSDIDSRLYRCHEFSGESCHSDHSIICHP